MIPQDLHFDFSFALYLILICPLLIVFYLYLFSYREKTLKLFAFKENLQKLATPRSKWIYFLKVLSFCLAWVLLVFALMQPKGNGYYPNKQSGAEQEEIKQKPHDVIFLIDASASMSIVDEGKTRLEFAKEIVDETASLLQGENASLYAFTSILTKMSPPTPDLFFVRLMLRQLSINEGGTEGTDFKKALTPLLEKYSKEPSRLMTFILLSDGGDTSLYGISDNEKEAAIDKIIADLGSLLTPNSTLTTIGLGTIKPSLIPNMNYQGKPVYSGLEETLLKRLSEKGNGSYIKANDFTALHISKELMKQILKKTKTSNEGQTTDPKSLIVYQEFYQLPLGIALLLLIFYLIFPNSFLFSKTFLLMLFFSLTLQASLDTELKEAQNFFEAGVSLQAENIYQEILKKNLTPFEKTIVLYNLGTLFLNSNEPKKAGDTFDLIPFTNEIPSFILRRIKTNSSIAKFREALLLENNSRKRIYLLILSEKALTAAIKAACTQDHLEGRSNCIIPADLSVLSTSIHQQLKGHSPEDFTLFSIEQFHAKIAEISLKSEKLKVVTKEDLKKLLGFAIEMEQEVLVMTGQMNQLNEMPGQALKALKEGQVQTLKIADRYLKEVYAMQRSSYKNQECQKKPWNEILPLYNKGYNAALNALNEIVLAETEDLSHLFLSFSHEEEAIKYWKMANQKSAKKEEDNKKPEKLDEKVKSTSQSALQLLQEMQAGDKRQKAYPKTSKQEVMRPW